MEDQLLRSISIPHDRQNFISCFQEDVDCCDGVVVGLYGRSFKIELGLMKMAKMN